MRENLWYDELCSSSKCLLYGKLKKVFGGGYYITQCPDIYVFALNEFRCSCHKLEIELGRRNGVERESRICQFCDINSVGDEFHCIFECPKFHENLSQFISKTFLSVKSMFSFCNLLSAGKKVQLN